MGVIYIVIPVSCALMLVYFAAAAWRGGSVSTGKDQ
jgi:TRAP-type C4-dicarboxylate transport system permease small subunit